MDILGNLEKVLSFIIRANGWNITLKGDPTLTKNIEITIPDGDATQTLVSDSSTNILTNKTIDSAGAGNNITLDADAANTTISNIDNDEIKAGAAIDAAKIHDGSVSNTEFGYISTVTSNVQDQIDADVLALSDHLADTVDSHDASSISYDNASSGLTATEVQAAVDEVEGRLDTAESNITTNATNLSDHEAEATGAHASSAVSYDNTISGLTAVNVKTAIDEVEGRLDTAETNIGSNDTDITNLQNDKADKTTTVTGTGAISGGGDLSANRTLDVAALGIDTARLAAGAVTDAKVNDVAASKITGNFPTISLDSGTVAIATNDIALPAAATHITITGTGPVNSFSGATAGRYVQIKNITGAGLTFTNGAALVTGTGGDLELADDATIIVYYDGAAYNVVGGAGGGAGGLELVEVSTTATAEISTHYLVDTSAAAFTITLPDASSLSAAKKKSATIKFSDSSESWTDKNLTIAPASGETIDGFAVDETFVLDVSGSTVEMSWDDVNAHWALDLGGAGAGGGGGLTIEEYAYGSLPATLVKDVHYLVDFGGGSSLTASATMPAVGSEAGAIKVTPINDAGGCKITLTRGSTDQFNDPDLGLDTTYDVDVGSATFNTNVNDATWEITDAYWNAATDVFINKRQRKFWGAAITTTKTAVTFNNVNPAKKYKVTFNFIATINPAAGVENCNMYVDDAAGDRHYIGFSALSRTSSEFGQVFLGSHVITPASSTLDIKTNITNGTISATGTGSSHVGYIEIEELNNIQDTTDWT
jgi:hypothetical protein